MTAKLGLEELAKVKEEVGVGRMEVRTIKLICAVAGIPNTVVSEAREVLAAVNVRLLGQDKKLEDLRAEGKVDKQETRANVAQLKVAHRSRRGVRSATKKATKATHKVDEKELKRLEQILKRFE